MKSIKEKGLIEVRTLKKRIGRAFGMDAISAIDHDFLREHLDAVEDRIQSMNEVDSGVEIHIHGPSQ